MEGRCRVRAATLRGVEAVPVDVEVAVGPGVPGFSVVGMADASVQESRERVRSALRACGFVVPSRKVVVNLAPGALRKTGSGFDLPIAVGVLIATGQVDPRFAQGRLLAGELSLEGEVRPVAGLLAYALCARDIGCDLLCAEAPEGLVRVEGVKRLSIRSLSEFRRGEFPPASTATPAPAPALVDFRDIAGHEMAKRALQIAAAGGHGVIMVGPPGSGKTMLASRLPSILPPLSEDEALQTALVHSVAGEDPAPALAGVRPFRSPHHTASAAGLIGGGSPLRPGEISMAHNGVLFLDELPEFRPSVLQSMRQPLESGRVVITRADGNVVFPARFTLVAAANPCPCGYFGDPERACSCTIPQMRSYQARVGGPLMDRIDVRIDVRRIPPGEVLGTGGGTSSAALREGVLRAREYASWRRAVDADEWGASDAGDAEAGDAGARRETAGAPAGGAGAAALVRSCRLSADDEAFYEDVARGNRMSGRAIMRTLAVARTVADMEEARAVGRRHLCEALAFRLRDGEDA